MPTLQRQIQQLATQLEQLAAQVVEQPTQKLSNLDSILMQAKLSPFKQHTLQTYDEHTKSIYMVTLLTVVAKSETKQLEQHMIIAKIYYGMDFEMSFEQLIQKSNSLTLKQYEEFYSVIQEHQLQNAFLIDALMLAGIAGDQRTHTYVANIASCFQLQEKTFIEACHIVKAILQVNDAAMRTIFEQSDTFWHVAMPYLLAINSKNVPSVIIKGDGHTIVDLSNYFADTFILENVKIRNTSGKSIRNLKKFSLKNCVLDDDISLQLIDIDEIEIINIKFSSMKQSDEYLNVRPIKIYNAQNVIIRNVSLHSLKLNTSYLLKCKNIQQLTIEHCQFSKISISHNENIGFLTKMFSSLRGLIQVKETQHINNNNNTMTECKYLRYGSYYDISRLMNEGVDKGDVI